MDVEAHAVVIAEAEFVEPVIEKALAVAFVTEEVAEGAEVVEPYQALHLTADLMWLAAYLPFCYYFDNPYYHMYLLVAGQVPCFLSLDLV